VNGYVFMVICFVSVFEVNKTFVVYVWQNC